MEKNKEIINLPLHGVEVIIEAFLDGKVFLLLSRRSLMFENIDNFIKEIQCKNSEVFQIAKRLRVLDKQSPYITINALERTSLKIRNLSGNALFVCYLLGNSSKEMKKNILALLSKTHPEYIHLIKVVERNTYKIRVSQNILERINFCGVKRRSLQKDFNRNVNMADLFMKLNRGGLIDDMAIQTLRKQIINFNPIVDVTEMNSLLGVDSYLNSFSATYRAPNISHAHPDIIYNASGYSENKSLAFLKAIAEAHERFSLGFIEEDTQKIETDQLIKQKKIYKYLGISEMTYLRGNYLCKPPKEKLYPVLEGKILNKNGDNQWLVPIDIVKFPYNTENDRRFCHANTSGAATGVSFEDASIRGILEYSERHYFLRHWLLKEPFKRIDINSIPFNILKETRRIQRLTGGKIVFGLMASRSIPHIVAVFVGKDGAWPAFHFCSGVDFNKEDALKKAFQELLNSLTFCPLMRKKIYIKPFEVNHASDHYCFYHNPKNFKIVDPKNFFQGVINWSVVPNLIINNDQSFSDKLECLVDIATVYLGEITAIDITSPETALNGLSVIKIICEKGIPLWFGRTDLPIEKPIIRRNKHLLRKRYIRIHPLG